MPSKKTSQKSTSSSSENPSSSSPRPRRSARSKRILYTEFDDDSLESLLQDHEQNGIEHRAAKKRKDEYEWEHPGYEIPLDSLPALCVERILGYISNPRDLHSMSMVNKSMGGLITHKLVVRNAVFYSLRKKKDAHHRKTLSNIMGYLQNRSIHLPSAMRLLRLLNATQCERGDDCWGKNLCTGRPGALDVTSPCRPFGLAICDKCIKYGTTNISYSHFSRHQNGVAFFQWNKLMDALVDSKGERHGPLVRVIELQQIESSFDNSEDRNLHLESMIERAHAQSNTCPLHYEMNAERYCYLFQTAEKEADQRLIEEEELKEKAYAERREEKHSKKLARVKGIYDLLDEYLGDCPKKELALECDWRENDFSGQCVRFKCTIVEEAMRQMVSAPSTASDRAIRDAANQIKEAFTALENKNFFSYNFISESSNRYKKGLYEYCTTECTPLTILGASQADSVFISLIEGDQLTKALIRTFNRSHMARAFALAVVRTNPNAAESQTRVENYRSLAESVWRKKNSAYGSMSVSSMKESYNTCLEEFKVIKRNARDYLAHEQTAAFLRLDSLNQVGDFTRQRAIDQVFKPSTTDQYFSSEGRRLCAYDALKQRNYTNLRIIHEAYFRRPNNYSMNVNEENVI